MSLGRGLSMLENGPAFGITTPSSKTPFDQWEKQPEKMSTRTVGPQQRVGSLRPPTVGVEHIEPQGHLEQVGVKS